MREHMQMRQPIAKRYDNGQLEATLAIARSPRSSHLHRPRAIRVVIFNTAGIQQTHVIRVPQSPKKLIMGRGTVRLVRIGEQLEIVVIVLITARVIRIIVVEFDEGVQMKAR